MMIAITLMTLIVAQSWLLTILVIPFLMVWVALHLFSPMSTNIILPFGELDPMSTLLIVLTLWITNLMIMVSMKIKWYKMNPNLFLSSTLFLCMILILAFSSNNLLSFYIFFEASLIPTLIIILTWGYQPERLEAGMYLMLYTVSASLPLLMSIVMIFQSNKTTNFYLPLMSENLIPSMSITLTLAFLVKMPMYLTHLWLPKAHVEAPVAGSMVLASILLKLGGYGLLRLGYMMPSTIWSISHIVIPISMWGALLTAILCMRQTDMKSMIAYSSVSHMALVIAGIFSMSKWGWEGSLMMMIAHGLISSGLFALVNTYYENTHSRSLLVNNGLLSVTPTMAMWWFLMIAANMGAPPFINLMAEIVLMTSIVTHAYIYMVPLFGILLFTVCYSMILYTSLHHGPVKSSINFIYTLPTHFTVSLLHVAPAALLITTSDQLMSWI